MSDGALSSAASLEAFLERVSVELAGWGADSDLIAEIPSRIEQVQRLGSIRQSIDDLADQATGRTAGDQVRAAALTIVAIELGERDLRGEPKRPGRRGELERASKIVVELGDVVRGVERLRTDEGADKDLLLDLVKLAATCVGWVEFWVQVARPASEIGPRCVVCGLLFADMPEVRVGTGHAHRACAPAGHDGQGAS